MKTIKRIEKYDFSADEVFRCLDDLGVTGTHMTKRSGMMMGSKLTLEFLTPHHSSLGSKYRWTGKMMFIPMDFTVEVTRWVKGREKTWETVGPAKLIIYSWYRMHLAISGLDNHVQAELSITYEKPKGFLQKILSSIFADWYCRWCLRKMLGDAKTMLSKRMRHSLAVT